MTSSGDVGKHVVFGLGHARSGWSICRKPYLLLENSLFSEDKDRAGINSIGRTCIKPVRETSRSNPFLDLRFGSFFVATCGSRSPHKNLRNRILRTSAEIDYCVPFNYSYNNVIEFLRIFYINQNKNAIVVLNVCNSRLRLCKL